MSTVPQPSNGEPARSGPPSLNLNAVRRARMVAEMGAVPTGVVMLALRDLLVAYDNLAARTAWLAAEASES